MEGKRAFVIPDESREEYFDWVVGMKEKCGLTGSNQEEIWNTYNDPMIIVDLSFFSKHNCDVILNFLNKIKAKDISESYFIC